MAVFTHTLGQTYHTDEGTITSTTDTYTGDATANLTELVPTASTDAEYDLPITVANIKSMVLYSDHDIVIKTNSTSSPGNTVSLTAKKQVIWNTDSVMTKPFTVNVTKLFITNTSGSTATVQLRVLETIGV